MIVVINFNFFECALVNKTLCIHCVCSPGGMLFDLAFIIYHLAFSI